MDSNIQIYISIMYLSQHNTCSLSSGSPQTLIVCLCVSPDYQSAHPDRCLYHSHPTVFCPQFRTFFSEQGPNESPEPKFTVTKESGVQGLMLKYMLACNPY